MKETDFHAEMSLRITLRLNIFYHIWLSQVYKWNTWQIDKEKGLVSKWDISRFIDTPDKKILATKIILITKAILATKSKLQAEWEEIVKLQAFDWSYFRDGIHFEDDGTQNYLVLYSVQRYLKKLLIATIFLY